MILNLQACFQKFEIPEINTGYKSKCRLWLKMADTVSFQCRPLTTCVKKSWNLIEWED